MADAFEIALWVAIAIAACGAVARPQNRTAWALVASAVLSLALDWRGVEFNFLFWWLIDVLVLAVFVPLEPRFNLWRAFLRMGWTDRFVAAFFPVAWLAYLLPDPWRYYATTAIVVVQLLLTLPYAELRARLKRACRTPDKWNEFDLRVMA